MGETTKFERVAVDTLIPYVNNANIHSIIATSSSTDGNNSQEKKLN